MMKLSFPDTESERRAIGFLAGRFQFKTSADGSTLVPETALSRLAAEGIAFSVEGRAGYEQSISTIRDLLPLRFNDGRSVPDELIADTLLELREQFVAARTVGPWTLSPVPVPS